MYDVVGVGFGPSNVALAIAIEEYNQSHDQKDQLEAAFLEKKTSFSWHPGMMLPNAKMQIPFLKDLVSLRNVRSEYSFLNYLQDKGRVCDFLNKQSFFADREEFVDYLRWVVTRLKPNIQYGQTVSHIQTDYESGVATVSVEGSSEEIVTKNIVLAPGISERIPQGFSLSQRVFHNLKLLDHLSTVPGHEQKAFLVLGAGQSAAECAQYLHEAYPESEVHAVFARLGYSPSDSSPFVNRIFDPETIDWWHGASGEVQDRLLKYHWTSNYSGVDINVIKDLYNRTYQEKVRRVQRLFMHCCHEVVGVEESASSVDVRIRNITDDVVSELNVDAVVLATGFCQNDPRVLLGESASAYRFEDAQPVVKRDYQLESLFENAPGVYLNGGVEHSHGLTSSLLSATAVRVQDITDSIVRRRDARDHVANVGHVEYSEAVNM